ncbi:MAG TPA: DUF397 domain-containing protein [Pseudonocardiaceae bacterium]
MTATRHEGALLALATATNWHKASYSQGQSTCVEVGSATISNWHKASYSQGANTCVEVGSTDTVIGVRDTKLGPASPILTFDAMNWAMFTASLSAEQ